jgi:trk system potassium uptake protein TrkH
MPRPPRSPAAPGRLARALRRLRWRLGVAPRQAWRETMGTARWVGATGRRTVGLPLSLWRGLVRGWRRASPPAVFVASFGLLIALGTAGLMLLPGLERGPALGLIDATFTITSAVCVTGLAVVDTATHFTRLGQAWLLLFIQLGGIGLVTLTTLIIGALGRKLSLRSEMTSVVVVHRDGGDDIRHLVVAVARFTLTVEAVGATVLFALWVPRFGAIDAAWHAVFHAVSAFCNAGFSTFTDSLTSFDDHPLVLLVVSALIVLGGLGFLVLGELARWRRGQRGHRRRLSSHSYAAVVTTAALLAFGTVCYGVFEWNRTLGHLGVIDRAVNAWFMSVTARTAGFNTVSYAQVGSDSAFLTILLMIVGGSPGSTAGGLKTTTLAVLVAMAASRVRGQVHSALHGRGIPEETLERAVSLTLLSIAVMTVAFFALNAAMHAAAPSSEAHAVFLPLAFEMVSAFSTVGLSMDLTPSLNAGAEVVLILLMFVGRVGLLAFFSALLLRRGRPSATYRRAQEDLVVG